MPDITTEFSNIDFVNSLSNTFTNPHRADKSLKRHTTQGFSPLVDVP